jgi:pimeloyl-ACP methyl ester carboxylesterase
MAAAGRTTQRVDAQAATQPAAQAGADHAGTQPAAGSGERYTYIACHGATAGGWEWKRVSARLEADGHTMYRPSYTGLGERAHLATPEVGLDTHIADIVNVILFEDLHDVVLVGHSYGGMVITGVADRVPDRVRTLVYVDALVPEDGESVETARWSASDSASTTRAAATRPSPMTTGTLGQPIRANAKPPYNVVQPPRTFSQPIALKNRDRARQVPAVYILTVDPGQTPEQDRFYAFAQRAMRYGWTVWNMESDHVPSMSRPAELTKLLEAAPGAAKPARQ